MSAIEKKRWTVEEYLKFEREHEFKHELIDGEVYAMSGASMRHNRINLNTASTLNSQLRGKDCEAFASDMRIAIPSGGNYTYPDIVVVCGERDYTDANVDTLSNPILIIEVLSPSTELYDRTKKFQNYRTLKSLQEYILIAQNEPRVERFVRQDDGQWLLSDETSMDGRIELTAIGCTLSLADIYDRVSFNTPSSSEAKGDTSSVESSNEND